MPEWITNISTAGLPKEAVFVVILLLWATRELVPAISRWRNTNFEERKYGDGEAKAAREALVEELRRQVAELAADVKVLTRQHAESAAAHVKCQIEQEQLRGELNVMKEKLVRLEKHDKANQDNTKKLAEIVKEETGKAPTIV